MSERPQHLELRELAHLLERARQGAGIESMMATDPHLASCSACRGTLQSLVEQESELQSLPLQQVKARGPECPDPAVWLEVAGGVSSPDQTLIYVEHASRCGHCGSHLRASVKEITGLDRELTEDERKQIRALASSQPQWQARLAERIAGTTRDGRKPAKWWRNWLLVPALGSVGALAVLAVGVGWWVWSERNSADSADRYLARAYTEQRTLELRMSGAEHAPLRVQKGPAESFVARPASLLKAEAMIASQLAAHPEDPAWLQAAARADVLEGKYDAAVESLQRALELKPHAPELLLDLGTAYFQRAQSEDRQEDYGAAFEYISQVLARQPDNPTALFNRAIVAEHQFLYHQALEDWERYLRLDSTSQWADEARNRAEAVRAKLKQHEADGALLSPDQIASAPEGAANPELERRVEEYLDAAVRSWLPLAYPEGSRPGDLHAQQALFFLAELTAQQHEDRWLSDLLKGSSAPTFSRAVASLARASRSNNSGDYTTSATQAAQAAQMFRASGNQAGALRAQFELAYSEQLTRRTDECRRGATAALAEAERLPYAWLQVQLGLEKGVCVFLGQDDWGADERFSRRAMERARESSYDGLYARSLYFVADDQVRSGDLPRGLKSASDALGVFWNAQMPAFRGFNLYDLLGQIPEFITERPHLVMTIWREATALAEADQDLLVRFRAYSSAGRAAASIHQPDIAQRQYSEAARLLTLAPRTAALQQQILVNEIRTAGAETHLDKFELGIARLSRIQNQILPADKNLQEMFYATLGDLELRSNHPTQAEQAFRPALESAEQRLASLNSEVERVNWSKEAAPVYLGMAEAELLQGHDQRSLEYFEWYLGAAGRSGRNNPNRIQPTSAAPDPAWLASRFPLLSGQTVLGYAALPDGLAIWTYDNRGVNAQWIPQSNHGLQELAARFHELASNPKSAPAALRRDSRALYGALIAPVEARLESGRTLVIEADEWLAQVPFEALLDSNGHYLIERAPIVHSLGQNMDASLHQEAPISADLKALVVGSVASSQTDGLLPLPDVLAEADAVTRTFHSPIVLNGPDATLSAVEDALPRAAVFHFTGHSLVRPIGASLVLKANASRKGAPALLGADRFRRLDVRDLQLAVLSTCNAASGNDGSRGFNSIAEALERAGVPHVVASRWAVDSVETQAFVQDFYGNALKGQSVSESIRQASRRMMADPRTSHPYYWSAFSAYGRP